MDAARVERVRQRAPDVLLADEFVELARTPLAGEDEVTHAARLRFRSLRRKGGGPRQNTPGTRRCRYRCSLPGLAGFTAGRREGSDASHHEGWRSYQPTQSFGSGGGPSGAYDW